MCKHLNIDVGPQALQCGPSICTFVTTNIHQNARDGENPVPFSHEWFQMGMNISSPTFACHLRGGRTIFICPLLSGMEPSMFFFCCCFWRNRRQLRADAHMLWPETWRRRNAIGRQVLLIRSRFNDSIAVELVAGVCRTLNPTLGHCSFRPRRAGLIIPRTHKHQMLLLLWENLGHGSVQDEWMDPSSVGL